MIYLICEGTPDMLDVKVLRLILVNHLYKNIRIEAVGGESSLKSVARWFEDKSGNKDRAYVIEDRNFRPLPVVEQTWQNPGGKNFIWRRHEIENYLLDPRIIAEAFQTLRNSGVRGSDVLPTTEQEALALLEHLARPLLEHHAGKLTFHKIQSEQNQIGTQLLGPKHSYLLSQSAPDALYPDRTGWLTYFQQECQRLKQACQNLIHDVRFDFPAIQQIYSTLLSQVNTPNFFNQHTFLRDLGGHELISQLLQHLHNVFRFHISLSDLTNELLNASDRLYNPDFFDPDDFQELASKLI